MGRPIDPPIRKCKILRIESKCRGRGRPKIVWRETIPKDMHLLDMDEHLASNRASWGQKIHIADP